jgi:Tfp pilus assembly protein PilN
MAVPKDKLWLRSLDEKSGVLTLEGSAMDNDTVALFMTNLGKAAPIISVDLESTRLKNLKKYKLDITDFVLKCKTYSYKKEEPEPQTEKAVSRPRKRKL